MPESQCGELVIGLAAGDDELWDRQQAVRRQAVVEKTKNSVLG